MMDLKDLRWESRFVSHPCLVLKGDDGTEILFKWDTVRQMCQNMRGYDSFPHLSQAQMDALKREGFATSYHGGSIQLTREFMDWFDNQ